MIDLVINVDTNPSARLGRIALDAELAGLPWVARLSRGFGGVVQAAANALEWRCWD